MSSGPQIIGNWEIEAVLGSGAMGVVYRAINPRIGRYAAIKVMKHGFEGDEELISRFYTEGTAASRLKHPNIVEVTDMGEHEGLPYIVMELVEGRDLDAILKSISEGKEFVSFVDRVRFIQKICSGLNYAHEQNVVHRDIKPANILVGSHGEVKILDFGLARLESAAKTKTGVLMGTPYYMSPEHFGKGMKKGDHLDGRSDLFSLGVVFYELLAIQRPFEGSMYEVLDMIPREPHSPLNEVLPGSPPELCEIVDIVLAKNREDRYRSCAEFSDALEGVLHELPRLELSLADQVEVLSRELQQAASLFETPALKGLVDPGFFSVETNLTKEQLDDYAEKLRYHSLLSFRLAELEESVNAAQKILDLISEAQTFRDSGDLEKRRGTLQAALDLYPDSSELQRLLADCEKDLENRRKEEERQMRLLTALTVAQTAIDREDYERCIQSADSALELEPENEQAKSLKKDALKLLERKTRLNSLLIKARELQRNGQFRECLEAVKEALVLAPEHGIFLDIRREAEEALLRQERVKKLLEEYHARMEEKVFSSALDLVVEIRSIEPGLAGLDEFETRTRKALEREREIIELVSAARVRQQNSAWDSCLNIVLEGLELDPDNEEFKALKRTAESEIEKQRRRSSLLDKTKELIRRKAFGEAESVLLELERLGADDPEVESVRTVVIEGIRRQQVLEQLTADAFDLEEKANWSECLETVERALSIDPTLSQLQQLRDLAASELKRIQTIEHLLVTARTRLAERKPKEAQESLAKLLELDETHKDALRLKLLVEEQLERREKAAVLYNQALEYSRSKNWALCVKKLEEALEVDPEDTKVREFRGLASKRLNLQVKQAKDLVSRIRLHLKTGEFERASVDLQELEKIDPVNSGLGELEQSLKAGIEHVEQMEGLKRLAREQLESGQLEESLASVKRAFEESPEDPELTQLKAQIVEKQRIRALAEEIERLIAGGEFGHAQRKLSELKKIDPANSGLGELEQSLKAGLEHVEQIEGLKRVAREQLEGGQLEESLAAVKRALEESPEDPALTRLQAQIVEKQRIRALAEEIKGLIGGGEFGQAQTKLSELEKIDPANPGLGELEQSLKAGLEHVEQIEGLKRVAREQLEGGQLEESQASVKRALEESPEDPALTQLQAQIVEKQRIHALAEEIKGLIAGGEFGQAQTKLSELGKIDPANPGLGELEQSLKDGIEYVEQVEGLKRLAREQLESGQLEESLAAVKRALEESPEDPALTQLQAQIVEKQRIHALAEEIEGLIAGGEFGQAQTKLSELEKIDPANPRLGELEHSRKAGLEHVEQLEGLKRVAREQLENGQLEESLATVKRALEESPEDPELTQLQAQIVEKQRIRALAVEIEGLIAGGEFGQAQTKLSELGKIDPANPRLGELEQSLNAGIERAKCISRLGREAQELLATKRFEECDALVEEGLALVPDDRGLLGIRAKSEEAKAQFAAEVLELRREIETCIESGRFDEADRLLKRVSVLSPDDSQIDSLAQHLEELRNRESMIESLLARADLAYQEGDLESCLRLGGEAEALQPDHETTRELIKRVCEAGVEDERKPELIRGLMVLARGRFEAGNAAGAIESVSHVLKIEPQNGEAITLKEELEETLLQAGPSTTESAHSQIVTESESAAVTEAERGTLEAGLQKEILDSRELKHWKRRESAIGVSVIDRVIASGKKGLASFSRQVRSFLTLFESRKTRQLVGFVGGACLILAVLYAIRTDESRMEPTTLKEAVVNTDQGVLTPSASGELVLNVSPWAQIDSITDLSDSSEVDLGSESVTPLRLALPSGHYKIRVSNPELEASLEFEVGIEVGETSFVTKAFPDEVFESQVNEILKK